MTAWEFVAVFPWSGILYRMSSPADRFFNIVCFIVQISAIVSFVVFNIIKKILKAKNQVDEKEKKE